MTETEIQELALKIAAHLRNDGYPVYGKNGSESIAEAIREAVK